MQKNGREELGGIIHLFIKVICHPSHSSGDSEQLTLRIIMSHTQFIRTEETVLAFCLMPLQVAVICII